MVSYIFTKWNNNRNKEVLSHDLFRYPPSPCPLPLPWLQPSLEYPLAAVLSRDITPAGGTTGVCPPTGKDQVPETNGYPRKNARYQGQTVGLPLPRQCKILASLSFFAGGYYDIIKTQQACLSLSYIKTFGFFTIGKFDRFLISDGNKLQINFHQGVHLK